MEKLNIILENGIDTDVNCMFYLYNSKYYFIYTTKEIDENGYVILYLTQIGKEVKNTPQGSMETGYMIGVEITDPEEWKLVQTSIAKIVESAKSKIADPEIQILPLSMLTKLKILGKKKFRLLKEIVKSDLNVEFDNEPKEEAMQLQQEVAPEEEQNVVIDYRAKFFEEQDKNEELVKEIEGLNSKLDEIKRIVAPETIKEETPVEQQPEGLEPPLEQPTE